MAVFNLSAIRDLYDGSIVSYVLGYSNNNKLVFETLDQATKLLEGDHPLIHSDRGFQLGYFIKRSKFVIETYDNIEDKIVFK